MIVDASMKILFSEEVLFTVEFQFLICEILDCLKLSTLNSLFSQKHTLKPNKGLMTA